MPHLAAVALPRREAAPQAFRLNMCQAKPVSVIQRRLALPSALARLFVKIGLPISITSERPKISQAPGPS